MVKDHADSDRGNPLAPHGLLFPMSSKGSLYASSHRQDNPYHGLCYTSRGALAGTRHITIGVTHILNYPHINQIKFIHYFCFYCGVLQNTLLEYI